MPKKPSSTAKSGVSFYNAQSGKLSGREIKAQKRLEQLIAQYQTDGLSSADARERALKEMRDNARGDWRNG